MAEQENGGRRLSRRAALGLGAAAAAAMVRPAAAQQKIDQKTANYQAKPNGALHCEICDNFQPPKGCKFVDGDINPNGWCQHLYPKLRCSWS